MQNRPHIEAHVAFDHHAFGVRAQIRVGNTLRTFDGTGPVMLPDDNRALPNEEVDRTMLRLSEEEARALYDALTDYFGHGGAATRMLRRDYDAERKRVDLLIGHLISESAR